MRDTVFIPCTGHPEKVSHIAVTLSHDKGRKSVFGSAYPSEDGPAGTNILHITSGEYLNVETMPRLNRNRLTALRVQLLRDIANKSGIYWEFIQKSAAKFGVAV